MPWDEVVRTVSSAGTLVAVLIAAQQLLLNRRQARATFEDSMSREYRALVGDLPADAFHATGDCTQTLAEAEKKAMFRYFDLSNEQLRFCDAGRVSRETAEAWRNGIRENLNLPRFRQAWRELERLIPDGHFTKLTEVLAPAGTPGKIEGPERRGAMAAPERPADDEQPA
jgi:hypothetical protein